MLNQPLPPPISALLDRCAEVSRDAADTIEHDPGIEGPKRALHELRAPALVVAHLADNVHVGHEYIEALQVVMGARTRRELIAQCQTRPKVQDA